MLIPGLDQNAVTRNQMDLDVEKFIQAFFLATGETEYTLFVKSRKTELVRPRQMLAYLLWLNFGKKIVKNRKVMPLKTIGRLMGGQNHATILNSKKAVLNDLETSISFQNELIGIVTRMREHFHVFPIKIVE